MRRSWPLLFVSAGCWLTLAGCPQPQSPTTLIYLVRHAEKQKPGSPKKPAGPPLNNQGERRAKALERLFRSNPLHAVYATQYRRTADTVRHVAKSKGLTIKMVKAHDTKQLLTLLKTRHAGQSVLISGHSNTVPAIINALGVKQKIKLVEATDYDNLFVVLWTPHTPARLIRLHVGPLPPPL